MNQLHPFWLIAFTLAIALIPILAGIATAYIKVSIVMSLLRNGLGAQQLPGSLVVMVLSLALTFYIMAPVLQQSAQIAAQLDFAPLLKKPDFEALRPYAAVLLPWRDFMQQHSGRREIAALQRLARESGMPASAQAQQPLAVAVIVPAFVITELKEAFAMGFALLLPFLLVDLIVANILSGLGMFMVSPLLISLPLKLLLFTISDGWLLLSQALISSYRV